VLLAFLAVTAVINIALGYALARYLDRSALPASDDHSLELPTRQTTASIVADEPPPSAPAAQVEAAPTPAAVRSELSEAPNGSPSAPSQPAEHVESLPHDAEAGADAESPPVEHELLAGIEEFRSQLAQLKGGAEAAATQAPAVAQA